MKLIRSLVMGCALVASTLSFADTQATTNLDIVKSTYEGETAEENGRNLMKHLADDAKWREADGFPLAGVYVGPDAIRKNVFERIAADWSEYRFVVEGYIAQHNKVAAYGTYEGVYGSTNKAFSARVTHIWTLDAGKITAFEQFVDSKPVVDAMR
ncbi:nuclear transport factor 2 family protein [Spongorhabdus nitratireducens]